VVADEDVVRVSDPETRWGLVCVEQAPRTTRADHQIVHDYVLGFNRVFDKDVVPHSVVDDIFLNSEVGDSVNCHCAVVCLVDGISLH